MEIVIPKILKLRKDFFVYPCIPKDKIFCVYFMSDFNGNIVYVGKSKVHKDRIRQHVKIQFSQIVYCTFFNSEEEMNCAEKACIIFLQPEKKYTN